MTARNGNIRFMENNVLAASASTVTFSGAAAGFPGANVYEPERWKRWTFTGVFVVTSSNKTLYIADGTNKTITLTEATYATGTALAAHIQTQLNASSTLWTCTYNEVAGAYLFKIARSSGTATLRLTQTTNAAWSMLGFTGAADTSSTPFTADEQRNHTSERIYLDAGIAKRIRAALMCGPSGESFGLSSSAVVTIMGNSINSFTAPPLSATFTEIDRNGAMLFLDDLTDTTYRYWVLDIQDRTNPNGPALSISQVYLGDYVELVDRNLNKGFRKTLVDPTEIKKSDSGVFYGRRKNKYWRFDSMSIEHLEDDERQEIEEMVEELGTDQPFWISIDPLAGISYALSELTRYVRFDGDFELQHVIYNKFSLSFSVEEVV